MTATTLRLQARLDRGDFALDVNMALPGHGITALFGPSGSGKTTCLRVLAGLECSAVGRVQVGEHVWQDSERGRFVPTHQRAIGYVFQEASLFDHLTVEGNLRFGFDRTPSAERRHDWRHGLELLGIGHLLQRLPQELSGGERQRVAIARALAASPRVLLMDEPLAALDAARKAEILPWLEQLHEALDLPVVYVTHSVDEVARLADHVVLLDGGRVRAEGPVTDMMTRPDLPLAHSDHAGTVLLAHTSQAMADDELNALQLSCGRLLLMPRTTERALPPNKQVRVSVMARDVSLSLDKPLHSSVLNILSARVIELEPDGPGQVLVSLDISPEGPPTRLMARISQLSARRLEIAPGLAVYAQIKGVAMVR
jgi:molybdate transport system ATP-binding protein